MSQPTGPDSGSAFSVPESVDLAYDVDGNPTPQQTAPMLPPPPPMPPRAAQQTPIVPPIPPPARTPLQPKLPTRGAGAPPMPPPPQPQPTPRPPVPAPAPAPDFSRPAPTVPPVVPAPAPAQAVPTPAEDVRPSLPDAADEENEWLTSEPEPWDDDSWDDVTQTTSTANGATTVTTTEILATDDEEEPEKPNLFSGLLSGLNPQSKNSAKKKAPAKRAAVGGTPIGLRVFRVVLISFLVFGMLLGIKNMFFPVQVPSVTTIAAAVSKKLGANNFPSEKASTLALRYANTYLNNLPEQTENRTNSLVAMSPDVNAQAYAGSFQAFQYVVSGPFIDSIRVADDNTAVATVAAVVSDSPDGFGNWTYLEIPLTADPLGNLAVAGPPALVPAPGVAAVRTVEPVIEPDADAEKSLRQFLPVYFAAWANSDPNALAQYVAVNSTAAAQAGLAGNVTLHSIDQITISTVETQPKIIPEVENVPDNMDVRQAWAEITWKDRLGSTFKQAYVLTLEQDTTSLKWLVQDIQGGVALTTGSLPPATDGSTPSATPSTSASPATQ